MIVLNGKQKYGKIEGEGLPTFKYSILADDGGRAVKSEELIEAEATAKADLESYAKSAAASGGRRRARPQTKKAAKKTCYPGYEVYNFRKNSKGVFYNCLPKKRTTRRRKV